MTTPTLSPTRFRPPLQNPSPGGLFSATAWAEDDVERWLAGGVQFEPVNYSGEGQFGIWGADWCGEPGEVKEGDRPDPEDVFPDPFEPLVVWAWDHTYCGDVREGARTEVRERVAQVLRLQEQTAVETAFATRVLADAGPPDMVANLVEAVVALEQELAATNVTGFVHARPGVLASLVAAQLVARSGAAWRTPAGHTLVFGSGYVDPLGDTLVATSQPYGWRGTVRVQDELDPRTNTFVALAERDVVVGVESVIAAVEVS